MRYYPPVHRFLPSVRGYEVIRRIPELKVYSSIGQSKLDFSTGFQTKNGGCPSDLHSKTFGIDFNQRLENVFFQTAFKPWVWRDSGSPLPIVVVYEYQFFPSSVCLRDIESYVFNMKAQVWKDMMQSWFFRIFMTTSKTVKANNWTEWENECIQLVTNIS